MRWTLSLILALSAGALFGYAVVMGWVESLQGQLIQLLVGVLIAFILGLFAGAKYFLNGFAVGFLASLIASLILFFQMDVYFAHRTAAKAVAESASIDDLKETARVAFLLFSPLGALVIGSVQGALTLGAAKILGKQHAYDKELKA